LDEKELIIEIPEEEQFLDILLEDRVAKAQFTVKYLWQVNKHDHDYWPSKPHCHNLEHGWKLNVYTGIIYNVVNKQPIKQLKIKELMLVQKKLVEVGFELKEDKKE